MADFWTRDVCDRFMAIWPGARLRDLQEDESE
jgi:hypothetical protein